MNLNKKNKKFTIGYNHQPDFYRVISKFKNYISGIYFPLPNNIAGSGRSIPQNDNYAQEIEKIINYCSRNQIKSELLLNASCEGENIGDLKYMDKIVNYIKKLEAIGLKRIVLNNLLYIKKFKENTNLEIEASVILNIYNLNKVDLVTKLGVDSVCLAAEVNKDLEFLKIIKHKFPDLNTKIMLNEACLPDCPFRQTHFNFNAHHYNGEELSEVICDIILEKNPEIFFKIPFIRPDELYNYLGIVDEFKLVSRCRKSINVYKILKAYVTGIYNGNFLDILELDPLRKHIGYIDYYKLINSNYLDKVGTCDNNCSTCNYCNDLLKQLTYQS